jgi:hypothetical protein
MLSLNFARCTSEAVVPRGQTGSFDKDGVFPPSQFITRNDERWIFYGAASERHYGIGRDMKIGLAKLRLDVFVCLEAEDEPGMIVTKAFKLEGRSSFQTESNKGTLSGADKPADY